MCLMIFSKPVTAQILPQNMLPIVKNTNVIALGMYKVHTKPNQTRTPQLHQDIRKPNKRVSFSTGVIPNTSVSRPQLKSNHLEDRCVLNDNHDLCVLHYINGVNSRTRQPMAVPISTREPKQNVNQSVATSSKKTVATDSTVKKSRNITRKLYEQVSKTCSWWYPKYTPHGYNWKPKSQKGNVNPNVSMPLGNASRTANILEPMTPSQFCDADLEVAFRKSTCYIHDLKGNDLLIGSDLEVAFRKSTCYIRDLKGNDLLTGSRGTNMYSITHRLSHLNFDTINLLSKNNIVTGLPKLKFIKDHLCSSCELRNAKRKSFLTKTSPSSKRRLQLLHMDLCGPMQVESINGKKYVIVIVDDYSRYTWTHFLRSKDETPVVLIYFLTLVQRGLHAQVRIV
ncbi:retrovirus-related pol polyprotein from transposon TNT 1-94 [Tanacetum coccineum]